MRECLTMIHIGREITQKSEDQALETGMTKSQVDEMKRNSGF